MQTPQGGIHDICTSRAKLRAFLFDQVKPAKERLLVERDAGEIQFDIVQSKHDKTRKPGRGNGGAGGRGGAQPHQQGGQAQQPGGQHISRQDRCSSKVVVANHKEAEVSSQGPRNSSREEMAEAEVEEDDEDGAGETRLLC
jgi:hypothetical protein